MADLATLPVLPHTAGRLRSCIHRVSSVIDEAPPDCPVSPRLGHYLPGRLLASKGAEYPPFPTAQVHARGGSPPERVRDRQWCNPASLQPCAVFQGARVPRLSLARAHALARACAHALALALAHWPLSGR